MAQQKQKKKTKKISINTATFKKEDKTPQQTRQKSPSGLPTRVIVSNQSMFRVQSFKTTDFARKITYDLIDSVYDRTILKKIITKYKFSIVPNYFQVQVENLDGTRNAELEKLITPISSIITRDLLMNAVKGFFLYGTSIIYKGDVNERGEYNQLFLLRIQDLEPEYDWEKVRFHVNEGARVLKGEDKIFIFFSASGTGAEYCMGYLWADNDADLMDKASWNKTAEPVLSTEDLTGEVGPGHNSFVYDEEGSLLLIYHARPESHLAKECGTYDDESLYDPCRHARIKRIDFDSKGYPVIL